MANDGWRRGRKAIRHPPSSLSRAIRVGILLVREAPRPRDERTPTMPAPLRSSQPSSLRDRDPSDPLRRAVELAQRGRMILDVSAADLEAAEAALGPFHPTTWHFRNALEEARRSWD